MDEKEVTAAIRKHDSGLYYDFGAIVDGAFVPFSAVPAGNVDEAVAAHAAEQNAQAQQQSQG